MNQAQIKNQWQEEEALRRFQLISPLLNDELDLAKKLQLRKEIASVNDISIRTLYRYEEKWRNGQFAGLKPVDKEQIISAKLPENYEEIVTQAKQLKKEVPERSVSQIITILELEGWAKPGALKRSTLQKHLLKEGFGRKQLLMYREARESSSKRFCKPHRMMLIQADIKYGPQLPLGKNGAKVKTYLSSAIDDHSRYILFSKFYDNQEGDVVEDTFHQVILRHGSFDRCYFDNGSQYIATQLNRSLARLGIKVSFAKRRSAKSKGKIEKFHIVVDGFLREVKLKKIKTLDELNYWWKIYLEEHYQKRAHSGIEEYYKSLGATIPEEGISPIQEFNRDSRALCFLDTTVVAEAFMHHEERKVDKGGCISFRGKKYETKPE
ncbi:MAG: DDE-type integrase/transposase/recombinase, partial [Eubacteriales bacterium]